MLNNGKINKELSFGRDAREKIGVGIEKLSNAVKTTMGASGKNVIIEQVFTPPTITKDGVTVARSIYLKDPLENIGAEAIKEVAIKTVNVCGDGPQPLTAKILTPTGFTTMGEIKVGDKICGTNGTIQEVLAVYNKGEKKLCKVRFSDNRTVECCEDHTWTVIKNRNNPKDYTVKEIIETNKICENRNGIKKYCFSVPRTFVEFGEKELILDPYFLGVLLGDGSLSCKNANPEVCIGYKKSHIVEMIRDLIPRDVTMSVSDDAKKHCLRLKFSCELKDYLEKLRLLGKLSGEKFIPKDYLYSSLVQRKKLLKGLIDTDGYINKRGLIEYSSTSIQLANDFVELLRGIGKVCTIWKHERTEIDGSYSMNPIYKVKELKGCTTGDKIVSIEQTDEIVPMRCIKVSNADQLYITDNYIVTHNTTTSVALASAIYREGMKLVSAGHSAVSLKKGIDYASNKVVELLKEQAIDVDGNEDIKKIGTISANGDEEIGEIIATAMKAVGKDGVVTIEESKNFDTTLDVVEGLQIDKGYISPYFVTDSDKMQVEMKEPYILIYERNLSNLKALMPVLSLVAKANVPLLIIADDIEGNVMPTLITNKLNGVLNVCGVRSPSFGDRRRDILNDIAILTGTKVINPELNMKLENLKLEDLGRAKKVIITKDDTTFVDGFGDKDAIQERIKSIEVAIENATSNYDRDKQKERLAKMTGGVAVINVGAVTELEMKEKKDRVEDALHATKAGVEEGIVTGGGVALLNVYNKLCNDNFEELSEKERYGAKIVLEVLKEPAKIIAENAGESPDVIVNEILSKKTNGYGYNARTNKFENLLESGVIDPVKVTRLAFQNACSISSLLLTTDCCVSIIPEENKEEN